MTTVQRYEPSRTLLRRVEREMSVLTVRTGLAAARIEAQAEVEAVRANAVSAVGQRAMLEVALTTKLERELSETVPAAVSRLTTIGDLTTVALSDVLLSAARRIGRA